MKFATTLALFAVVTGRKTLHEKLMEEIAKQERLNPSGNGFYDKKEIKEEERENKLSMLRQFDSVNINNVDIKGSQERAAKAINDKFQAADNFDKKYQVKNNVHAVVDDWNNFMNNPNQRMEIQKEYMTKVNDIYEKQGIKKEVNERYAKTDFKTPFNKATLKTQAAYKEARKKGIIGMPTPSEPHHLLFANQDALVGLTQSGAFMKNSNFTLDEVLVYSCIICITMAGIVYMTEKLLSEDDKPKVVKAASTDIEMQNTKESKKSVKKTLKQVMKQNNAKVGLMQN